MSISAASITERAQEDSRNQETEESVSSWGKWSVQDIGSQAGNGALIAFASIAWVALLIIFTPVILTVGISLGAVGVLNAVLGLKVHCLERLLPFQT